MSKLDGFLAEYVAASNKFLKNWFAVKAREAAGIDPGLKDAVRVFANYSSGGKRIRGALTIIGYRLAGGRSLDSILPVSCGIELLHNFLLVHDDIVDADLLRRGKPTVHARLGVPKAIILGDIGAFLGYELILGADFTPEKINAAMRQLNGFLLKTGYGEFLDIDFDLKKNLGWGDIIKVRTYKTAYYTFIMPLTVGAILAGGSENLLRQIKEYGLNVGIAFQIADDILGVFGDPAKTGKSNASDITDGKKTLLYTKALELASAADKKYLQKNYGRSGIGKSEIVRIRQIIEKSGALAFSRKQAGELVQKGKRSISSPILTELADFVISRER